MNDTSPPQQPKPRPRPPANGRPTGGGKPRAPRNMSRESRFVGYLVLGFGLLAVIAVLVLAFSNSGDGNAPVANNAPGPSAAATAQTPTPALLPRDLVNDLSSLESRRAKTQDGGRDLFFERTPKFDASAMEGDWQAMIGNYTAVLQIRKNVFQIILASSDPNAPRYYSSGTFTVNEDILMLVPQQDWPPPASASANISYAKLTRGSFPIIARFEGGKMLWQNPPESEKRVSGPYTSPIFMAEKTRLATWQKIK